MKVKLVFQDWQDTEGNSVYKTDKGIWLSMGAFHSGTIFEAEIDFDKDDQLDIADGIRQGYTPVFYLLLKED